VLEIFKDFKKANDSVRREVLYIFLTEFGTPVKLVKLIKMCLNETYNTVQVGNHVSDIFPIIEERGCLPPMLSTLFIIHH
jgi:hypothetical protein